MTHALTPDDAVTPDVMRTAAALLSCRFGRANDEAERRGRVRALLRSSRSLAQALELFVTRALPMTRGDQSTVDLNAEADAIAQALTDWSVALTTSADTYRACTCAGAASRTMTTGVLAATSAAGSRQGE